PPHPPLSTLSLHDALPIYFSGSLFVTSAKSETERKRVPGVIGRNCRMPILALEHGDRVAFFERDDRLFPGRATARPARGEAAGADRKSTRLNSSHQIISYA